MQPKRPAYTVDVLMRMAEIDRRREREERALDRSSVGRHVCTGEHGNPDAVDSGTVVHDGAVVLAGEIGSGWSIYATEPGWRRLLMSLQGL